MRAASDHAPAAIALDRVSKRFAERVALEDIDLHIAPGQVVGLLGPNGSGKTTCLRIIAGFLDPDAGQVAVAGHPMARERLAARACVGYMPENVPTYRDMRVAQYLAFAARLAGLGRRAAKARVAQVAAACGLDDMRARVIGRLSKGYRQRVGLAQALIAEPRVLLLDEPTAGLDPLQVREFRALVRDQAAHRTVIISSHVLGEIETMAQRLVILARGRVLGDGDLDELRARAALPADASLEQVFVALTRTRPDEARP